MKLRKKDVISHTSDYCLDSSFLDSTKIKAHQDRYFYFISEVENNDIFVPCRPLNPDVNVTLTLEGTNVRIMRKT